MPYPHVALLMLSVWVADATMPHDMPSRLDGMRVLARWELTVAMAGEARATLPLVAALQNEVLAWGDRYDRHQTKRLRQLLVELLKVHEKRKSRRDA